MVKYKNKSYTNLIINCSGSTSVNLTCMDTDINLAVSNLLLCFVRKSCLHKLDAAERHPSKLINGTKIRIFS